MSDVQFEEEEVLVDRASYSAEDHRSFLTKIIMKTGLAKTDTQANYVLIGVMFVCFLAMMFVVANYIL